MKSRHRYKPAAVFGCAVMLSGIAVSAPHAQKPPPPVQPGPGAPIPLPERNPARIFAQPHPGEIATPEWSAQEVQDATDRCAMLLAGTGVKYRFLNPIREGRCGTPAPIELSAIGKMRPVAIEPAARVTCGLAATLSSWADGFLQPTARKHLDGEITNIRNIASYVCRNRYNANDKPISEHARANALDMAAFKTQSGDWINVLDNWALPPESFPSAPDASQDKTVTPPPEAKPDTATAPAPAGQIPNRRAETEPAFEPRSAFLYEIHEGACTLFGTVLGPLANEAHKNHFHYDLAKRKHGAYCE